MSDPCKHVWERNESSENLGLMPVVKIKCSCCGIEKVVPDCFLTGLYMASKDAHVCIV